MTKNVLTNSKDFEEYKSKYFTDEGYRALEVYLKTLTEFYINKADSEYPFRMGILFGIPTFGWSNTIKSKDELLGRIKLLAQVLGVDKLQFNVGESIVYFELKEK